MELGFLLNESESDKSSGAGAFLSGVSRFLSDIFKDVAASLLVVMLTFCFATAVTTGILWYYQWPLILSPVGGFIVLGVMLLFWYDS